MRKIPVLLLMMFAAILAGCDDTTDPAGTGRLVIRMVDAPARYDAVNIVVKEVAVHSTSNGWMTINNTTRTFNLLSLTNGASTLLGETSLEAGQYTQVRLILDAASTIVVDGQTYTLIVPSALETGIKLVHNFTIEAGAQYELVLDFDASRSIVDLGTTFILQPVIRVKVMSQTGSISGVIQPAGSMALVTAMGANDTATTYANSSGGFKLMALNGGTYDVKIEATAGSYRDTTVIMVPVNAGSNTNIGTVTLVNQ